MVKFKPAYVPKEQSIYNKSEDRSAIYKMRSDEKILSLIEQAKNKILNHVPSPADSIINNMAKLANELTQEIEKTKIQKPIALKGSSFIGWFLKINHSEVGPFQCKQDALSYVEFNELYNVSIFQKRDSNV